MFENRAISIEKMVSQILRTGDIRDGRGISPEQKSRIRAEFELIRPENYHFSVPVNFRYNRSKANLNIFDIIDARHENKSRIELIGYTSEAPERFIPELEVLTLARAKLIAYIYMIKYELKELTIALFWYRRDSMVPIEYEEVYSLSNLEPEVEQFFLIFLEWARPFQGWKAIRDTSIRETDFPFTPFRKGQHEMMAQVFTAAKRREQRLIEAPTGIGKTMASLFPAIKALEAKSVHRLFYLTARNTGQEVAREAVRILAEKGLRLKTITITSKEKSCIRHDAIRECDDCKYSLGYYSRLKDGLHVAFRKDQLTRELIDSIGREYLLCPFELSLDLSLHADLIICDYNYVFDPNVVLKRFFAEIEENYLFLIDEVHNLVDRARGMFSAMVSLNAMKELYNAAGRILGDLGDQIVVVTEIMNNYRKWAQENNGERISDTPPYDLLKQLRNMLKIMDEWLALKEKRRFKKVLLEHYFEIRHFCNMAEQFDENYCSIGHILDGDFTMTLFNINPAPHLRKRLHWASSASLFSATVSPHHYFRTVLGMHKNAYTLSLPSPFPQEHLKLLIADPVSTKLAHRELSLNEVLGAIETVVTARPGNYMAFFPSYEYMNRVASQFRMKHKNVEVAIQFPGMNEEERALYLENFSQSRTDTEEHLLGFAVMGGIFGEGVDLVGDRLNGVIVVGVGLPGLSPEREQIRRYFEPLGSGFDFAYTYPGINKVLQAAGRVIRTSTDRGIVLLIDERFARTTYRELFPHHWKPELVRSREEIISAVHSFYGITTQDEVVTVEEKSN